MLLASFLSRACMKDCELTPAEQVVDRIHTNQFLSIPDHQLSETQREGERELCYPTLQRLKTTLDGFPDKKDDLLAAIHPSDSTPLHTSLKYLR